MGAIREHIIKLFATKRAFGGAAVAECGSTQLHNAALKMPERERGGDSMGDDRNDDKEMKGEGEGKGGGSIHDVRTKSGVLARLPDDKI